MQIALVGILLMACAGVFGLLQTFKAAIPAPYAPGIVDRQFESLKNSLPRGPGPIGFFSEPSVEANPSAYYLTQYALAPVVISSGTNRPLVIGVFAAPQRASQLAEANGLTMVRDFGNGIFLFRPGK